MLRRKGFCRDPRVFPHDVLDAVTAEASAAVADECWLFRRCGPVAEPAAECLHAVVAQRSCPVLAALVPAMNMVPVPRIKDHIAHNVTDQVRDPEAGLQGDGQQGSAAPYHVDTAGAARSAADSARSR